MWPRTIKENVKVEKDRTELVEETDKRKEIEQMLIRAAMGSETALKADDNSQGVFSITPSSIKSGLLGIHDADLIDDVFNFGKENRKQLVDDQFRLRDYLHVVGSEPMTGVEIKTLTDRASMGDPLVKLQLLAQIILKPYSEAVTSLVKSVDSIKNVFEYIVYLVIAYISTKYVLPMALEQIDPSPKKLKQRKRTRRTGKRGERRR